MKYNPAKHHCHSIRLKGYNYSSAGVCFITIVLQHCLHLFGRVHENGMHLSSAGTIARQCWEEIPLHFPHAALDEFIIMPDHMHEIIFILPDDDKSENNSGGVQLNATTRDTSISIAPTLNTSTSTRRDNYFSIISPKKKTLSVIIRTYKAAVTTICRENGFNGFELQRNYHDRIIRSDRALTAIRKYIINNPTKWWLDRKNQDRKSGT